MTEDQGRTLPTAPTWLPVGPGTPIKDPVPVAQDLWLDLWPAPKPPLRTRALRGLIPTVVMIMVTAALLGATAYSYRGVPPRDRTYLPTDGAYAQISMNGQVGQQEQGVVPGTDVTLLGSLGALVYQRADQNWLVDHDLVVVDAVSGSVKARMVLDSTRSGIGLLGVIVDNDAIAFDSAVPLTRGSRPQTQRIANLSSYGPDQKPDRVSGDVEATVADGCVSWRTRLTGEVSKPLILGVVLCPGGGVTGFSFTRDVGASIQVVTTSTHPADARFTLPFEASVLRPDTVKTWKPQKVEMKLVDAFGSGEFLPENRSIPPAFTHSGVLVLPTQDGTLAAIQLNGQVTWIAHPGGLIAKVVAVGDLIVVATANRQLVSYDDTGRRVWQATLPDVAGDIAVVGDRLYTLVIDGQVTAIDLRTGHQLWQRQIDSGRGVPGIVATADWVAAVDTEDNITVFAAAEGGEQGSVGGGVVEGMFIDGDHLVVQRFGRLIRFGLAGGGFDYDIDTGHGSGSLVVAGDLAVSSSATGLSTVNLHTGASLGPEQAGVTGVVTGAGAVMVARPGHVSVLTAALPAGSSWDVPATDSAPDMAIGSDVAVVVGSDGLVFLL